MVLLELESWGVCTYVYVRVCVHVCTSVHVCAPHAQGAPGELGWRHPRVQPKAAPGARQALTFCPGTDLLPRDGTPGDPQFPAPRSAPFPSGSQRDNGDPRSQLCSHPRLTGDGAGGPSTQGGGQAWRVPAGPSRVPRVLGGSGWRALLQCYRLETRRPKCSLWPATSGL